MSKLSPTQRQVLTMIARDDDDRAGCRTPRRPNGFPDRCQWRGCTAYRDRSFRALNRKGLIRLEWHRTGAGFSTRYWELTEAGFTTLHGPRPPAGS
jgi:hypothetical protein